MNLKMLEFSKPRFAKESKYILSGYLKFFKYRYLIPLLTAAGNRNHSNGSIYNVGSRGYYWTSSVDGDRSRNLNINSGSTNFNSNDRAYGFSVRCVALKKSIIKEV